MAPVVCKHKVPSDRKYIDLLANYLRNLLKLSGREKAAKDIVFAFQNAMKLTIEKAYGADKHRPVQVEFITRPDKIEIRIRDYGKTYTPAQSIAHNAESFEHGNLEFDMLEKTMDAVRYTPHPTRGGILKLIKSFS